MNKLLLYLSLCLLVGCTQKFGTFKKSPKGSFCSGKHQGVRKNEIGIRHPHPAF